MAIKKAYGAHSLLSNWEGLKRRGRFGYGIQGDEEIGRKIVRKGVPRARDSFLQDIMDVNRENLGGEGKVVQGNEWWEEEVLEKVWGLGGTSGGQARKRRGFLLIMGGEQKQERDARK